MRYNVYINVSTFYFHKIFSTTFCSFCIISEYAIFSGEYYVQLELRCCWDCRPCRQNEIVIANNTKCEQCEELYWPDEITYSECLPIVPTFLKWTDPLPLVSLVLALIGILCCKVVLMTYIRNWNERLIKVYFIQLSLII